MNAQNLTFLEACAEGASALRYRAERLRGLTADTGDEKIADEMVALWTNAAIMLDAMAGEKP